MRFKDIYGTAPRAFSKSFLTILAEILQCIFMPGTKRFICAPNKTQSAQIAKEYMDNYNSDTYIDLRQSVTPTEDFTKVETGTSPGDLYLFDQELNNLKGVTENMQDVWDSYALGEENQTGAKKIKDKLVPLWSTMVDYGGIRSVKGIKALLNKYGSEAFNKIRAITRFDHYFRNLCSIYQFVDSSNLITDDERFDYARIVRSQLSDCELAMLFYYCLNLDDMNGLMLIAEKYQIFKDLRDDLLADSSHKGLYSDKLRDCR